MERNFNGIEMSSEISIGKDGVTVSGEMDFGNGYGLGIENGKSGVSSSLTILGSQQGSVDRYGNYTPNENFLGEINGQDIIDLLKSQQQSSESEDAENPNDSGEEGPQGLVDLAFATGALAMSGLAAWAAGGSGSSAPSGGSSAGNGGNTTTVARRPGMSYQIIMTTMIRIKDLHAMNFLNTKLYRIS